MKNYKALLSVDKKWEHLRVCAGSEKEAKELTISTYKDYVKSGFIKDFKVIYIVED